MQMEDVPNVQNINLTSTVRVEADPNRKATITVPEELRLTPNLMNLLTQALAAQGLELAHMNISSRHVEELKDLPNVVLGEKSTEA